MDQENDLKIRYFIIGVQKAGTTYLKEQLALHPNIITHPTEEFGFFNPENFQDDDNIMKKWINHHFGSKVSSAEKKIMLAKNVDIMMSQRSFENLIKTYPDIKLIVILRDPIKRIISAYDYLLSRGIETEKNISKAIRYNSWGDSGNNQKKRSCNYIKNSKYSEILNVISKKVRPSDLYICYFENLMSNPDKEINKILKFMEQPPLAISTIKSEKVNSGHGALFPFLNKIFLIKGTVINKLWKKINPEKRIILINSFIKWNSKKTFTKTVLTNSDRNYLEKQLEKEIKLYYKDNTNEEIRNEENNSHFRSWKI